MSKKKPDSEAEIEKKRDAALMRALSMPPKPHQPKIKAPQKRKSKGD